MITRTLLATAAVCCIAPIASAGDLYVNPGQSIQAAINSAQDGDTVHVAQGTYYQSIDFLGKAITVTGANRATTVLDASSLPNRSVVSFQSDEGRDSVLEGFTIRGGTGSPYSGKMVGGGVYIDGSGPTVLNCIIEDNHTGIGGGIGHLNSHAYIANCIIRNNTANVAGSYGGAGLYADFGTLTLQNCEFSSNQALNSAVGGAMSFQFTRVNAVNCLLVNNEAGTWGGGVYNSLGLINLVNCTIAGNAAGYAGGGVYTRYLESSTAIKNSIVWDNSGGYGFGNIYDHMDAASTVMDCNIWWDAALGDYHAEDPKFADAANGDYRLGGDSSCIDLGQEAHLVLTDEFDLDGDGDVEESVPDLDLQDRIFGGAQGAIDLGAYEHQGGPIDPDPDPCPADTNGDGKVDITDLFAVLGGWGLCDGPEPCSADVDGSGMIDVVDLFAVLDAWGDCPQ